MGLESVKAEIVEQAEQEAHKLLKSAEEKSKQIEERFAMQLEEYKKEMIAEEAKEVEARERILLAKANSQAKQITMAAKKKILDTAFEEALEKIIHSKHDYFGNLLKKAHKEITISVISVNPRDKKSAKNCKSVMGTHAGGFVAYNADKSVALDYTYESIVAGLREKLLVEIGGMLF